MPKDDLIRWRTKCKFINYLIKQKDWW